MRASQQTSGFSLRPVAGTLRIAPFIASLARAKSDVMLCDSGRDERKSDCTVSVLYCTFPVRVQVFPCFLHVRHHSRPFCAGQPYALTLSLPPTLFSRFGYVMHKYYAIYRTARALRHVRSKGHHPRRVGPRADAG